MPISGEKLGENEEQLIEPIVPSVEKEMGIEDIVPEPATGNRQLATDALPLVSIVTVVLNGAEHLEQTIRSVLEQDYPNIEYLILDGGSTDGTLEIIQKYRDQLAYFHSKPDKGIYDAMNQGIALSHGALVGLKNSDDWFAPGAISQIVKTWQKTEAQVVYGDTGMVWQDEPLQWSLFPSDHKVLGKGQGIDHRNMFVTGEVYSKETYDLQYRIASDYDLMMRLWKMGVRFAHTGTVLGYKRGGGVSASPKILEELLDINTKYLGEKTARALYRRQKRAMRVQTAKNRVLRVIFGKTGYARFKARKATRGGGRDSA